MNYTHTYDIETANRAGGGRWFSPDNLRFFRSKVYPEVYGGRLFVSSELSPFPGDSRRYTVRSVDEDGSIDTVGEFGQHATLSAARRAAREEAANQPQ